LYTVSETEQVIITQFGEPMGDAITQAGLHVKIPFTQEANVFGEALAGMEWQCQPGSHPR
jgi:membrane protease subunit HflC